MSGFQPMREKLDIKILILFILRRLPDAVDGATLANLALADGAMGYFEYAECLAELEDSAHVDRTGNFYRITEKGSRNCEIVEGSLPYTIRTMLEKKVTPLAERMRRSSMIGTEHETGAGGCRVHLTLSDEMGVIAELRLLCGSEERAQLLEERFRAGAENYYNRIMEMLLE